MHEVRSVLIFGGQIVSELRRRVEPRKATFIINFVNKTERDATQKDLQTRISAMIDDIPDIRYLVRQGQRPARHLADHRRAGHRRDQRHRQPTRQRDELDPDHRESDIDRGARSARIAHRAQAPDRRRSRRFDRGPVGHDPRRHARRHRRQSRQVRRRATGWFRSASNSTSGAAGRRTARGSARRRPLRAAPCRFRSSPTSRSATAQLRSIATTARAASPSRAICAATRRSATRWRPSALCRPP